MDFRFLIFDCRLRGSRDSIRKVPFHSHLHFALRQRRRGAALIIVLASLVFLAALTLAFLASVNTELRSSKVYSAGTNAKLLAQTAVNLATAQISEASRGADSSGNTLAWASQLGMIRTYDTAGQPAGYYKLYSWTDMTGAGAFDHTLATNTVPANWSSQKAIFTDLNQPFRIASGAATNTVYPIIDGNNLTTMAAVDGNKTYGSNNVPDIEGFYVSANAPVAAGGGANPVPMPVKWLYVLEDGKITAPNPGATDNLAAIPGASATTQIIGRVAFWADDETCKVNINTASEGIYTDMPRVYGTVDRTLAANQPVQGEYQRYPGHPSMTSLRSVFPTLTADEIFSMVPRVQSGGSSAGAVATTGTAVAARITPDADRLFASVDELAFKTLVISGTRQSNDPTPNSPRVLTKETLERSQFFLTAGSKAPEINLFNTPRVSIWPLHQTDDNNHRTAFDRLMAFCSTLRNDLPSGARHRYYFQRADSTSPTHDLPSSSSVAGIGRNRMVLEYLQSLTRRHIPGFGGIFLAKYDSDNDQILTEIFDYIRSTNLHDSQIPDPANRYTVPVNSWGAGRGQVIPIEDTTNGTRGFGRFRTVQGASILFIANIDGDDPTSQVDANGYALADASKVASGFVRMEAIFLPQLFDPSLGSIYGFPNFKLRISGLENLLCNGVSMQFPANYTLSFSDYAKDNAYFGDQFGVHQVARSALVSKRFDVSKAAGFNFTGGDITMELITPDGSTVVQTVPINFPGGTFPAPQLGPDQIASIDYLGNPLDGKRYNMRYFIAGGSYNSANPDQPLSLNGGGGRLAGLSGFNSGAWFIDGDTVRSISASPGDMRLIAARKHTPFPGNSDYPFAPVGDWVGGTMRGMHTFFTGNGEPIFGAKLGRLVPGLAYDGYGTGVNTSMNSISWKGQFGSSSAASILVDGAALGKNTSFSSGDIPGDWDNAPLSNRDGPFINKADEGDRSTAGGPYSWKGRDGNAVLNDTLFTPNRQIPSAVTFGSLPSGVMANRPWQTLLFRPDPAGTHPGSRNRRGDGSYSAGMPADHLLLDLFVMPVVEPYAISEPLATAGKVNINYQIIPFNYINRDTALRAVLKSEKVIAIPDSEASRYKLTYASTPAQANVRLDVDTAQTLTGFSNRFEGEKDIFRSASEICELPIVPVGATYSNLTATGASNYWNTRKLTGDNSRERPYATIYPRLTTKSNTFTIHYRAQSLQKVRGGDPAIWDEAKDKVTGEFRGSQTIERFMDPNDPAIPDYADSTVTTPISDFYKTRILQAKQFAP